MFPHKLTHPNALRPGQHAHASRMGCRWGAWTWSITERTSSRRRDTVDIVHALEYSWEAGRMQFEEGSDELTAWVKKQEHRLYRGKTALAILSLNGFQITQRHNKRLRVIFGYLQKRMSMMNSDELRARGSRRRDRRCRGYGPSRHRKALRLRRHALDSRTSRGTSAATLHRNQRRMERVRQFRSISCACRRFF